MSPPLCAASRRAVRLAWQEAQRQGAEVIGPEHLLVGILKEGGVGALVLHSLGVGLRQAREEIERAEQDGRAAFARAREREWAVAHLGPEEPWAVAPAPVGIESGASPNGSTVGPQAAATTS
jgi:ATP-dependent Clp protease ATP-binding subunit ClpC